MPLARARGRLTLRQPLEPRTPGSCRACGSAARRLGHLLAQQALVEQRGDRVERVGRRPASPANRPADPLDRGQTGAAGEHRQAGEERADRPARAGRSSSRSRRAASAGARAGCCAPPASRLSCSPSRDRMRLRGEDPDARRGQLDGQRQPVQPDADLGDRRRVRGVDREVRAHGHGPLDEQGHRRELRERLEVRADGSGRAARAAAPGIPAHRRRAAATRLVASTRASGQPGQQLADLRRGLDHLLEVVEHQQHAACRPAGLRAGRAAPPPGSGMPSAWAMVGEHQGGLVDRCPAARRRRRRGMRSMASAASCSESRVLPVPPGPVSVSSAPAPAARPPPRQLALAAQEGRELGGQVVGHRVQRAQRPGTRRAGPRSPAWQSCSGRERSLSRNSPRSRRLTPSGSEDSASIRVAAETSTCPPCPALAMRAARWTSMPDVVVAAERPLAGCESPSAP